MNNESKTKSNNLAKFYKYKSRNKLKTNEALSANYANNTMKEKMKGIMIGTSVPKTYDKEESMS